MKKASKKGDDNAKKGKSKHHDKSDYQKNHNVHGRSNNRYNDSYNSHNSDHNKTFYREYQSKEEIASGIASHRYYVGKLRITPSKRRNAYVTVTDDNESIDILLEGEQDRNRALEGDDVVLEIEPISKWNEVMRPSESELMGDNVEDAITNIDNPKVDGDANESIGDSLWCPNYNLISDFGAKMTVNESETPMPVERDTAQYSNTVDGRGFENGNNESSVLYGNLARFAAEKSLQPKGKVVGIWERNVKGRIVGQIQLPHSVANQDKKEGTASSSCMRLPESEMKLFFHPSDVKYPNCIINRMDLPGNFIENPIDYASHIFSVELDTTNWSCRSKFPTAINVKSIGECGSIESETAAIVIENNISDKPFTDAMIMSLSEVLGKSFCENLISTSGTGTSVEDFYWQIPQHEIDKRLDLRDTCIFTIDPPTAKDLDDALHITRINEDTVEVGVHIADVSYFVRPGSLLDEEAKNRATSVYLVQRVIPMLPSILCEVLCSLNPNVDRLAYSCIWKMKLDGTMCDEPPWIGRTVIRCCAKIDYPTAQHMIDGLIAVQPIPPGVTDLSLLNQRYISPYWEKHRIPTMHTCEKVMADVILMNEVAMNRRKLRLAHGALVLNSTKLTFHLDHNGNPDRIAPYIVRDSNRLVEEYMLLANYLVAMESLNRVGDFAFLRNHPAPDSSKMTSLVDVSNFMNWGLDVSSANSMQQSLSRMTANSSPEVLKAMTALLMQPMQLANYIVAGGIESSKWQHYALSIPYYTHFTSPIRRYADVMVHRLLEGGVDAAFPGSDLLWQLSGVERDDHCASAHGDAVKSKKMYIDALGDIAHHCNDRKKASKAAQERSDIVYLAVHLINNTQLSDAIVIGIGPKTFSVLTTDQYGGLNKKLFIDEMDGIESGYNEHMKTLTLTNKGKVRNKKGHLEYGFDTLHLTLMTQITVSLSTKNCVPIDISVKLVGTKRE